jgi:hypothetical protein
MSDIINQKIKKRIFNNYEEAIRQHYIEEYIGKIYFNYLYQIFSDKYILYLLIQVEKLMCELLYPIIIKKNITNINYYELYLLAIEESKLHSGLTWHEYSNYITNNFSVYVEEFEDLYKLAPIEDKPIIKILIEHEQIIINYFSNLYTTNDYTEIEIFLHKYSKKSIHK